ncbi:hypothetical protein F4782DRAFT_535382 [Xylaria castorea]|nr:hypothetical protein F4782DRAFT_535382 [Xylaria castorea]
MKEAVEDTLGYDAEDPAPSLSIIPIKKILSLPWRAGEYYTENVSHPPDDDVSAASTRTVTSQCAGNPRWECEQLAAFLRAKNKAYDDSSTSVVVLARSNDPWKLEKENIDHAVLMQIVGSLITVFAKHVSEEVLFNMSTRLTVSDISRFSTHNDLDAGLAILSAFPQLDLDGKGLFLIVDLSDVYASEGGPSNDHQNLIKALFKIAVSNRAILIRVEATKTGSECFIHGPGGTHHNGPKSLQVIYDPTEDKQ